MTDVLGIDIGGSGIKGAPVNTTDGRLKVDRIRVDTPQPATPEAIASAVSTVTTHFEWSGKVGCAFPARVRRGVALTASNIDPAWIGLNVSELLTSSCGCDVAVVNDADAAGIAENRFGAARGRDGVVLLLTVGTGIGSALLVDGVLVPNTELGHLRFHDTIAENYASDRVRKEEDLSWKKWAPRFQEYLEYVEFLFSPDVIVLGGGISKEKKHAKYLHLLSTKAELLTAELENDAGIVGAALFADDTVRMKVTTN